MTSPGASTTARERTAQVQRRHVFVFGGFDPKGASFYHRLYQQEAARQQGVAGYRIEVGRRHKSAVRDDTWTVNFEQHGAACESRIEHVRWDDLVRAHWPRRAGPLLSDMVRSYGYALRCGVIPAVWRIAPKTLVAWIYPLAFFALTALLGIGMATLLAALLLQLGYAAWTLALLLPAVGAACLWLALRLEERLNTTWLARIFRFVSLQARGRIEGLEERLGAAATSIAGRMRDPDIDEVLIVGFSVGSILAVSAAARTLEAVPQDRAKLSLLTLGHCVPMLGLLPQAQRFREELATLAAAPGLVWVDFSSTTDWGSFALVDPIKACLGDAFSKPAKQVGPGGQGARTRWRSPRFHTLFDPQDYIQIRRDKQRIHMQYLMAGDKLGEYDYFALTAGSAPLSDQLD